ncbi:ionotropic receptor 40a-like [Periplaneta americana]|uniref:ionotropic receptor 40a-like n=1 Tax=Periplaneta americana TaxID=6978 RepID=UPI0037E7E018
MPDFFLWGYLKDRVYATRLQTLDDLKHNITQEIQAVDNRVFQRMAKDALWGDVWENGSGNGLSGLLSEGTADVGIGSMYLWYHKYLYFDYTFPYSRSIVTCLLPKPHLLPGWKIPTLPFNVNIWKSIFASLCLSAAAIYFVSKVSRKYLGDQHCRNELSILDVFFQTWRLLVLQVPNLKREDSIHAPLRLLISWLVVLFSLLTAMYSGGLASVLTVPRFEEPIDTMYELARSGIIWAAPHEAYIYSIKDSEDYYLQEVTRNFRVLTREALVKTSLSGDKGIAVERLTADHYVIDKYINETSISNFRIMKHKVYWGYNAMTARKSSPLLESMNRVIHKLVDSGIVLYWEGEVSRTYMSQRSQQAVRQSEAINTAGFEPKTLRLTHVQGPFVLLALGLIVAISVFILELLSFNVFRKPVNYN